MWFFCQFVIAQAELRGSSAMNCFSKGQIGVRKNELRVRSFRNMTNLLKISSTHFKKQICKKYFQMKAINFSTIS